MKKWMWFLIPGALLAGALLAGCFSSPTDPHAGAFSSVKGGGGIVPTATPVTHVTATPTPVVAVGNGSITGTISGTTSGTITITGFNYTTYRSFTTTRTGTGAYTLSGLTDGSYQVSASDTSGNAGAYLTSQVTISGGNSVSGIDIILY